MEPLANTSCCTDHFSVQITVNNVALPIIQDDDSNYYIESNLNTAISYKVESEEWVKGEFEKQSWPVTPYQIVLKRFSEPNHVCYFDVRVDGVKVKSCTLDADHARKIAGFKDGGAVKEFLFSLPRFTKSTSDRLEEARYGQIGLIEVECYEAEYVTNTYTNRKQLTYKQASKNDAGHVTGGDYTMSTTKVGRVLYTKDVGRKVHVWRKKALLSSVSIRYRMGHTLRELGLRVPEFPYIPPVEQYVVQGESGTKIRIMNRRKRSTICQIETTRVKQEQSAPVIIDLTNSDDADSADDGDSDVEFVGVKRVKMETVDLTDRPMDELNIPSCSREHSMDVERMSPSSSTNEAPTSPVSSPREDSANSHEAAQPGVQELTQSEEEDLLAIGDESMDCDELPNSGILVSQKIVSPKPVEKATVPSPEELLGEDNGDVILTPGDDILNSQRPSQELAVNETEKAPEMDEEGQDEGSQEVAKQSIQEVANTEQVNVTESVLSPEQSTSNEELVENTGPTDDHIHTGLATSGEIAVASSADDGEEVAGSVEPNTMPIQSEEGLPSAEGANSFEGETTIAELASTDTEGETTLAFAESEGNTTFEGDDTVPIMGNVTLDMNQGSDLREARQDATAVHQDSDLKDLPPVKEATIEVHHDSDLLPIGDTEARESSQVTDSGVSTERFVDSERMDEVNSASIDSEGLGGDDLNGGKNAADSDSLPID